MNQNIGVHPRQSDLAGPLPIWGCAAVSFLIWLCVILCLDPAGSYPNFPQGPGLTVDEIFNVEQGVYLVEQARALGWLNLVPGASQEAFHPRNGYNPDHPPLARLWLGIHHHLTWWLCPPRDPDGIIVTACARTGSATAFALLVFLLGSVATSWSGRAVGVMTAISLALMPRLFGHAHLAALETVTNLTCTAAVLAVAALWNGVAKPTWPSAMFAGALLGLALLTKIQAILIPIPVILWTLWRWRWDGIVPVAVWGIAASVTLLVCWPYLWFDPLGHLAEYLGRTTNRATIYVWYFGQRYADKSVPWHYPFVMFGITVPVILQLLGLLGVFRRSRFIDCTDRRSRSVMGVAPAERALDATNAAAPMPGSSFHSAGFQSVEFSRDLLLLGCLLFPLLVFSFPGIAVYDGERLFLTSFPLWAIFVGRGWQTLYQLLSRWIVSRATVNGACLLLFISAVSPLFSLAPCHLVYYNGIDKLFPHPQRPDQPLFEVDYWGVGITRELLGDLVKTVPADSSVSLTPTLHQFQVGDFHRQSPILRRHGIRMVEVPVEGTPLEFQLVYRRLADLTTPSTSASGDQTLAATRRGGRILAYLLRRPAETSDVP